MAGGLPGLTALHRGGRRALLPQTARPVGRFLLGGGGFYRLAVAEQGGFYVGAGGG